MPPARNERPERARCATGTQHRCEATASRYGPSRHQQRIQRRTTPRLHEGDPRRRACTGAHARRGPVRDRRAPHRRRAGDVLDRQVRPRVVRRGRDDAKARGQQAVHLRARALQSRMQHEPAGLRREVPVGDGAGAQRAARHGAQDGQRTRRRHRARGHPADAASVGPLARIDGAEPSLPRAQQCARAAARRRVPVPHQGRGRVRDDARQRHARVVQHELSGPLPSGAQGVRSALQLRAGDHGAGARDRDQLADPPRPQAVA